MYLERSLEIEQLQCKVDKLRAINADLLAACKKTIEVLESKRAFPEQVLTVEVTIDDLLSTLRAVIRKVEGERK